MLQLQPLLLALYLFTHGVQSMKAPTRKTVKPSSETSASAPIATEASIPRSSLSSLAPTQKIVKKISRPRQQNEPNPYLKYDTLAELVKNRPLKDRPAMTRDYIHAFATHKDVRDIDFRGNQVEVAKALHNLRDPQQDSDWQRKMSHTLKHFLKEKGIDDEKSANIRGYLHGQRMKTEDITRRNKVAGNEEEREIRRKRANDYYAAHKHQRTETKARRKMFFQQMDALHATSGNNQNERLSAIDIAKKAEDLRGVFPLEKNFRPALKAYLRKKKYSPDEIIMAQGLGAKERASASTREYYTVRKTKKVRGQSRAAASASDSPPLSHMGSSDATAVMSQDSAIRPGNKGKKSIEGGVIRQPSKQVKGKVGRQKELIGPGGPKKAANAAVATVPVDSISASPKSVSPKSSEIDELEAGPWWESGIFEQ